MFSDDKSILMMFVLIYLLKIIYSKDVVVSVLTPARGDVVDGGNENKLNRLISSRKPVAGEKASH